MGVRSGPQDELRGSLSSDERPQRERRAIGPQGERLQGSLSCHEHPERKRRASGPRLAIPELDRSGDPPTRPATTPCPAVPAP